MAAKTSPLMEQFGRIKRANPDSILFFRVGDFYETFHDDAVEAARLLGITLTSRNKNDPQPIPLAGIPWHQRDVYVARLLKQGRRVAICEQLEDPADTEMLEDLVVAAHTDARRKIDAATAEEMQKVTGGLQLPPGMKLPF